MKSIRCDKCGNLTLCYEYMLECWRCCACTWAEVVELRAELAKLSLELIHEKHVGRSHGSSRYSVRCELCVHNKAQEKANWMDEPTYLWENPLLKEWDYGMQAHPERRCETIYPKKVTNGT